MQLVKDIYKQYPWGEGKAAVSLSPHGYNYQPSQKSMGLLMDEYANATIAMT